MEFDAEFKFAKIQNSHFGVGGGGLQNLMRSSNLLKSKIPMCGGEGSQNWMWSSNLLKTKIPICGGGGRGWGWGGFQLLMPSPNLLKKNSCEKFSKFSGKNWNGFVLDFEYRVAALKSQNWSENFSWQQHQ